jgi:hypothetical protein
MKLDFRLHSNGLRLRVAGVTLEVDLSELDQLEYSLGSMAIVVDIYLRKHFEERQAKIAREDSRAAEEMRFHSALSEVEAIVERLNLLKDYFNLAEGMDASFTGEYDPQGMEWKFSNFKMADFSVNFINVMDFIQEFKDMGRDSYMESVD